jgi:murein DD-endopeptidase MepM/ murein hydrolase activator NlpD
MYRNAVLGVVVSVVVLSGCANQSAVLSTDESTSIPSMPTMLVSTVTASVTASLTPTLEPTETLTLVPTETPTLVPTETPIPVVIATEGDQWMVQATAQPETTFRYVFPIQDAKVSYGRDHHTYPATDIFVAEGSKFVAVTDGVVFHVTSEDLWSPDNDDPSLRSGLSVSILGDDGVRYHGSHLSGIAEGIAPGVRVEVGQLLGFTGKSGNAQNTPPHLHFGIARPTTPDDWKVRRGEMNPYEFLQAWQQGIPLQPVFVERDE